MTMDTTYICGTVVLMVQIGKLDVAANNIVIPADTATGLFLFNLDFLITKCKSRRYADSK